MFEIAEFHKCMYCNPTPSSETQEKINFGLHRFRPFDFLLTRLSASRSPRMIELLNRTGKRKLEIQLSFICFLNKGRYIQSNVQRLLVFFIPGTEAVTKILAWIPQLLQTPSWKLACGNLGFHFRCRLHPPVKEISQRVKYWWRVTLYL